MADKIEVSEIFGPTIQGEGPSSGTLAMFVRLRRCPLACYWCDTKYTWDKTSPGFSVFREMTCEEIWKEIKGNTRPELVVITGGEPLIWQRQLQPLIRMIAYGAKDVEIETSGVIAPALYFGLEEKYVRFNVSPKLKSSGNEKRKRINPPALEVFSRMSWRGVARFKFVVTTEEDFREIEKLMLEYFINPTSIWVMPEGSTAYKQYSVLTQILNLAIKYDFNFTTRLHTLAWGNQRGK